MEASPVPVHTVSNHKVLRSHTNGEGKQEPNSTVVSEYVVLLADTLPQDMEVLYSG